MKTLVAFSLAATLAFTIASPSSTAAAAQQTSWIFSAIIFSSESVRRPLSLDEGQD